MKQLIQRMTAVAAPKVTGPVTVGHGVNEFLSIVIPPVIPLLVSDFGITYAQAGFLLTIFFIMYSIFQLPAGIVADRIGKRPLMIVGLFGMSIGILLASLAESYGMLLVAQSITGISGSTYHPTGMSIVSDVETSETEGKAMGVFGFGGALGTMLSPVIVGGLAIVGGWRIALAGAAILAAVVTVGSAIPLLRSNTKADPPMATDGGKTHSMRGRLAKLNVLRSVPLSKGLVLLFLATMILSMQHRAIQTFSTSYIAAETGASLSAGNLTFFALLVGGSVGSLWAGDLADRFSRELLGASAAIGTAVFVAGTIAVTYVIGSLPYVIVVSVFSVWFVVIGVLMYASYPVKNALVSDKAEKSYSGSLFGIIQTASAIGSASGPAVFGAIATRWGVIAAFPSIAVVSVILAVLFVLLWLDTDRT